MTDTAIEHHGPSLQVYGTIFVCLLIGTGLTPGPSTLVVKTSTS